MFLIHSSGSLNDLEPEIFALVPTINLHSLRIDKAHGFLGTLTAIFSSRLRDCFNFLSLSFNTKVICPGQNFSEILSAISSKTAILESSLLEKPKMGKNFEGFFFLFDRVILLHFYYMDHN